MADATAADPSVGVREQLHCFFFAWGFPSSLRPCSSLAPAWRQRLRAEPVFPPALAKKKQWSCSHANGGVGGNTCGKRLMGEAKPSSCQSVVPSLELIVLARLLSPSDYRRSKDPSHLKRTATICGSAVRSVAHATDYCAPEKCL